MTAIVIYLAVYAGLILLCISDAPLDTEIGHD